MDKICFELLSFVSNNIVWLPSSRMLNVYNYMSYISQTGLYTGNLYDSQPLRQYVW